MSATAVTTHSGLHEALLAVQADTPTLPKNAINPHFKSKYTPLDTVVETMGPILQRHGLTWMSKPSISAQGAPALAYKLTHAASGQFEEGEMLLLSKGDPQGQGSALTYARRYSMTAVLNIVADEDVDGNEPAEPAPPKPPKKLTAAQLAKVKERLTGVTLEDLTIQLSAQGLDVIDYAAPAQAKIILEALGV